MTSKRTLDEIDSAFVSGVEKGIDMARQQLSRVRDGLHLHPDLVSLINDLLDGTGPGIHSLKALQAEINRGEHDLFNR